MIKNFLASIVTLALVAGIVSPVIAETNSNHENNEVKSKTEVEYEVDGVKYKKEIEIKYEDGKLRKKIKIEGPDGRFEYKDVKTVDDVAPGEEVKDEDFDDGVLYDSGKRCADFEDVSVEDKLCKYLHKAKVKSVVSANSRYKSNAPVSRAQFAGMVVRAFGLEADITAETTFADVDDANTFYEQIMTLKALDIISGAETESGERYFPRMPITRGQAIKILVNTLEATGYFEFEEGTVEEVKSKFKDENLENDVFVEFVTKLYASEEKMPELIVKGYSDGYLRTGRFISRLEATVMIMRAMWAAGLIEEIEEIIPTVTPTVTASPTPEDEDENNEDGDEIEDKEVEIEMSMYEFSPNLITVKAGQKVEIDLESLDATHNFVIDELDVNSANIEEGEDDKVEFTIPSDAVVGTMYKFYCSIDEHRENGMEGTIKVVE